MLNISNTRPFAQPSNLKSKRRKKALNSVLLLAVTSPKHGLAKDKSSRKQISARNIEASKREKKLRLRRRGGLFILFSSLRCWVCAREAANITESARETKERFRPKSRGFESVNASKEPREKICRFEGRTYLRLSD